MEVINVVLEMGRLYSLEHNKTAANKWLKLTTGAVVQFDFCAPYKVYTNIEHSVSRKQVAA